MSLVVGGGVVGEVIYMRHELVFQKVVSIGYSVIDLEHINLYAIDLACDASGVGFGIMLSSAQSVIDSDALCACYVDADNLLHCNINLPNGQGFDSCTINLFKFVK